MTRNAASGQGLLHTVLIPAGPLGIVWTRGEQESARVHVNAHDLLWTLYGLSSTKYSTDWKKSISTGTMVFLSDETPRRIKDGVVAGTARGRILFLSADQLASNPENFSHELIHAAQSDFLTTTIGRPLERVLLSKLGPGSAPIFEHLELGVAHLPIQEVLRPMLEAEANRFEIRPR